MKIINDVNNMRLIDILEIIEERNEITYCLNGRNYGILKLGDIYYINNSIKQIQIRKHCSRVDCKYWTFNDITLGDSMLESTVENYFHEK